MARRRIHSRTKAQLNRMTDAIEDKAFVLYSNNVISMQALDAISKAMDRARVKIKNK